MGMLVPVTALAQVTLCVNEQRYFLFPVHKVVGGFSRVGSHSVPLWISSAILFEEEVCPLTAKGSLSSSLCLAETGQGNNEGALETNLIWENGLAVANRMHCVLSTNNHFNLNALSYAFPIFLPLKCKIDVIKISGNIEESKHKLYTQTSSS